MEKVLSVEVVKNKKEDSKEDQIVVTLEVPATEATQRVEVMTRGSLLKTIGVTKANVKIAEGMLEVHTEAGDAEGVILEKKRLLDAQKEEHEKFKSVLIAIEEKEKKDA
jgi:hypothetical protein